jgi:Flp pilus assembly protein TadB
VTRDELSKGRRWDLYLGGVVRRYFLVMIGLGLVGAVIAGLNAVWPPLVWIVAAAVLVAALALFLRWAGRSDSSH